MASAGLTTPKSRRLPALDGVRAIAVALVIAYHLNAPFAQGGYLGVDLFFVLSGFLITSLLVEEHAKNGRIRLAAFWGRRARRLLPGLILMLVVLGGFYAIAGPGLLVDLNAVRGDAIATIAYVANWHQLFAHQAYFAQYEAPSPLQHTWSLAIEEQFYVLWPFIVLAVLAFGRRAWRATGIAVGVVGAAASTAWMAYLSVHGAGINRLYYGTDTRAADLLVGAALAFVTVARPAPRDGEAVGRAGRLLTMAGPLALVGFALFAWRASGAGVSESSGMYRGGFLVAALLCAVVVADVRRDLRTPLVRVLSLRPLVFVGRISYELYLWHWPVICELSPARLGFGGTRLILVRIGATLVLSVVAYLFIDEPLRRYGFRGWPMALRVATAPVGMAAAAAVMVLGTAPVAVTQARSGTRVVPVPPAGHHHHRGAPAVPGAGGIVGGPITLSARPTRAHRLKVVLIGDSVMRGNAPGIAAALDSTGVVSVKDDGVDGWGFTTDPGWRVDVPHQLELDHAQIVIAMWSFDNGYLTTHLAQYRTWMDEFTRLVLHTPGVEGLLFQQFPALGDLPYGVTRTDRNIGVDDWNAIVRSEVASDPHHIAYLPLAPAVERNGHFTFWLPPENKWSLPASQWVRVRPTDATHFCAPGAVRYADALLADLTPMFHLPPASPDWSLGNLHAGTTYTEPPGFCPDDHPSSLSNTG
jgi:peptidoglycan/LPS O-acetylase OafA/YrhL